MTWVTWLAAAVLIAAVAALTGLTPRGTRPVARSRLMGVARLVLVALAILLVYLFFRAPSGE
jgi:hypothetical protein